MANFRLRSKVKNKSKYPLMMRFSLLSVSLVLASSLSVSAAVPEWQRAFPGHSYAAIELIATMPSLAVIIFLLLSGWIAKQLSPKKTVILGLIISGLFGILPLIVTNYYLMLLSRFGFGVGLGLINGLAVSLIGTFFAGDEKNILMGIRSGFEMFGDAVCAYIAGALLVDYGWHSSFLVYGLAFPVAILFYLYVPEPTTPTSTPTAVKKERRRRLNPDVLFWTILLAVYQITYVGATVRLAEFIEDSKIGSVQQAAMIISIAPFFGLMGGIIFGRALQYLRKYLLPLAIIASGVSQIIVSFAHSFFTAAFGMFLVTMLDTIVVSYILNIATEISEPQNLNVVTSILLIGSNCGIFLAPVALGSVNNLFNTNSPGLSFLISGIGLLLIGGIGIYDLRFIGHRIFRD
ncbi:MFS transporter [Fructilactobacillus florum]|uniref:MFS transporter n=1 Tax=Fructilactobacillus florum TaxID=640331 RepID=UPI001CDA7573|nr:MFS transporter [Fructilactobacillus florum]